MEITREQYMEVIKREIEELETRIQQHDTGHIITAVQVLRNRLNELELED